MAKSKNFDQKIFSVGIDSECFETYFKTKISKSKIFSHYKMFSWDLVIFYPKWPKWWRNGEAEKFWQKFFWSESIQNVLKRILKRKSQNRKFFPLQNFSWTQSFFGQSGERMAKSKHFGRKIFSRNRFRMFQNIF